MSASEPDPEAFLTAVDKLMICDCRLTRLQAGLLAATQLDIAHDSRSFARLLGVPHALVLRVLAELGEREGLIRVTKRDARTMRNHYALGEEGESLCALSGKLEILQTRNGSLAGHSSAN
ncbi:MAG: hypothetical protein BGO03_01630 [Mesorhizobium sp. 61-13]|nr:hypothetical protein [Mesorhizobium sp.]OJU48508.1 MAG: hypothetical protein BGO03_01630 [Mesorhizobium sp. 61-13]